MTSLRRRLSLGLFASLILLLAVLWWTTSGMIQRLGENLILARLSHDIETLLVALQEGADGELQLDSAQMPSIYRRAFSGHYYLITIEGQPPISSRSLWDETLAVDSQPPGERLRHYLEGPQGTRLLALSAGYRKAGRTVSLTLAEDVSIIDEDIANFHRYFGVITLLLLVVLMLVQRQVVRSVFAGLEGLRGELRRLQGGEITTLSESVPEEVQPLVGEINHLLELLNRRLQRSRNAVGNLAHALKTPLSLLQQATSDPRLTGEAELQRELSERIEQIRQLMERELKRARLAGGGRPGLAFSADDELPTLQTLFARIYPQVALQLHYPQKLRLALDRDDMLELLGNLLDNACKWATSRVEVRFESEGATLLLQVEDDGPGVEAEDLASLTERGTRLDEMAEGHGLGLAIVRDIVELYEGRLEFARSAKLGGLQVTIHLPLGAARS